MSSDFGYGIKRPFGPQGSYLVNQAHSLCRSSGCHYAEGMGLVRQAEAVLKGSSKLTINQAYGEGQKTMAPAQALICESGETEHPFSSRKGHVEVHRTVYDRDGMLEYTEDITLCLVHGNGKTKRPDEIESHYDAEGTAD